MMVKCVDCKHLKRLPQVRLPMLCLLANPSKGGRMSKKDALMEHKCSRFEPIEPEKEEMNCPLCTRRLSSDEYGKYCQVCGYDNRRIPMTPRTKKKAKEKTEKQNAIHKEILRKIQARETLSKTEVKIFYSKAMEER